MNAQSLAGVTGAALKRDNIVFFQLGAAFEHYETGEFFEEMSRRFSQKKYDDNKRQESLDKKQREDEGNRRTQAVKMKRKQEYLSRKQESGEDTRECYATKEELWYGFKHMIQARTKCSRVCMMQS